LEFTKPDEPDLQVGVNGNGLLKMDEIEENGEDVSEPATPTIEEEPSAEESSLGTNKKKKRKRSKKGKH